MTEVDLIWALPEGETIAAFIVIVILFVRYLEKIHVRVESMSKLFSGKVNEMVSDMLQVTRDTNATMIEIAETTTAAINGLEHAVRDLLNQIKQVAGSIL